MVELDEPTPLRSKELVKNGEWLVAPKVACMALDILRCGCCKPVKHSGMCYSRKLHKRRRFDSFRELAKAIHDSAVAFGAEPELENAALVLVAGMWTRKKLELREITGLRDTQFISIVAKRCVQNELWLPETTVHLGEMSEEHGDLEFWLNAMVASGKLTVDHRADGPYYSAVSPMSGLKGEL